MGAQRGHQLPRGRRTGSNLGLILMGAVVLFAATAFPGASTTREKQSYILLLLMGGGILGAFASLDLFFFYFFHELALVPTFLMIGIWGRGEDKNYATYQITLYLSVGRLARAARLAGHLFAIAAVPTARSTSSELTHYFKAHPMQAGAAALDFSRPALRLRHPGFALALPHVGARWATVRRRRATAMIHAGVLKKFGLYGLIRIALAADAGRGATMGLRPLGPLPGQHSSIAAWSPCASAISTCSSAIPASPTWASPFWALPA